MNDENLMDLEQLLRDLRGDDLQISKQAARILCRSGDERFLAPLLEYVADESRLNRSGVVYGMRHFKPDLVLQPLLRALSDDAWTVRTGAFDALATMGEVRAIPALIEFLESLASGQGETDALGNRKGWSTGIYLLRIGEMCRRVGDVSLFHGAIAPLRHFLNDPREELRDRAAKGLYDLGEPV